MHLQTAPAIATKPVAVPDDPDEKMLALWLAQRPPTTTRCYLRTWNMLARVTGGLELRAIRLVHLQSFVRSLRDMKPSSQVTFIGNVQALFAFARKLGYLTDNPASLLKRPKFASDIAERIVDEEDIQRLWTLTANPRDATLLRLAYVAGLRVAELSSLQWKCFVSRDDGAVLTVTGKGKKTRHIFLPAHICVALVALRQGAAESAPIFVSRERHPVSGKPVALSCNSMHRIVKQAAQRAGLPPAFSMHWCRHAHASHALDRGAPIHLVQHTLGHVSLATTCRYIHCKPGTSSAQFINPGAAGAPPLPPSPGPAP